VVPFFSRGRITAVAAVATRVTDYSQEDVVQLTPFLDSIEAATIRGCADAVLRPRNTRAESATEANTAVETEGDRRWILNP
jgi:hypothetical protein